MSQEGLDLRPVRVSSISFVDLAGSERGSVYNSETPKERMRQSEVCVNHSTMVQVVSIFSISSQDKLLLSIS